MKPSISKGTRDFLPHQVAKRKFIFNILESVFKKYGYLPIETPALELLSTLTGKYGEEGDQLLFKILNNGDFLSKANETALSEKNSAALISSISKRGLRYDLTVPFARFVVMYQNDLQLPFKRYQMQPVWRADRPQKGRYQEFYQCDVDVVGSNSLMCEAELVQILDEAFYKLNVKAIIKVNNRKILNGLAESHGIKDKFMAMTINIDKLDKIGEDGVINEMIKSGIDESIAKSILELLDIKDLDSLEKAFSNSEIGQKGIEELRDFHKYLDTYDLHNTVKFDVSLARGLSYYTGCIIEVEADKSAYPELSMGSIAGGGRYDDLTGVFGMKNVSGVGVSFGFDRIYDVMEEEGLFPQGISKDIQILLSALDAESHLYAFRLLNTLRAADIPSDLYPAPVKMKRQMKYAHERKVPFVGIVGSEEMKDEVVMLKNMETGEQQKIPVTRLIEKLSQR